MAEYRTENTGDSTPNFEQMIRTGIDTSLANTRVALPGIVQSFNSDKQTADVLPALKIEVTKEDGSIEKINYPTLLNVPVHFTRGGGFSITHPLNKDDSGLLIFMDRCIDYWALQGGIQEQALKRMHDLSDAVFIPGINGTRNAVSGLNMGAIEIRNASGDVKITLENSKITISGNSEVSIEASQIKLDSSTFLWGSLDMGTHRHIDAEGRLTGTPVP